MEKSNVARSMREKIAKCCSSAVTTSTWHTRKCGFDHSFQRSAFPSNRNNGSSVVVVLIRMSSGVTTQVGCWASLCTGKMRRNQSLRPWPVSAGSHAGGLEKSWRMEQQTREMLPRLLTPWARVISRVTWESLWRSQS